MPQGGRARDSVAPGPGPVDRWVHRPGRAKSLESARSGAWAADRCGSAGGVRAGVESSTRSRRPEAVGRKWFVRPALRATEPGPGVRPEGRPVVAALLEDHESSAERGGSPAALVVDRGREGEVANGVVA